MSDRYTTLTHQSWFSRIGQSLTGTLFGLLLFLASFFLLFWNEGRAVKTHKMLQEGAGIVISISSDRIDAANEGKLVHVSGRADTAAELTDPMFGVMVNAIHLRRSVEMLQWHEDKRSETRKKLGGGTETITTFSYSKKWSPHLVSSSGFHAGGYDNPGSMSIEAQSWQSPNVSLGAFRLNSTQINGIDNFELVPLSGSIRLDQSLAERSQFENGTLYLGSNRHDQIGDLRVQLLAVYPAEISVVSSQAGESFKPYETEAGGAIEILSDGIVSAAAMFEAEEAANTLLTWVLRFVGLMMMFVGLKMVVRILSVLADLVPMFGNLVGAGTGIIAFLVALVLSLVTIAIAWLFYRPLISGGLIVLAVVALWLVRSQAKKVGAGQRVTPKPSPEAGDWGR